MGEQSGFAERGKACGGGSAGLAVWTTGAAGCGRPARARGRLRAAGPGRCVSGTACASSAGACSAVGNMDAGGPRGRGVLPLPREPCRPV